ncbi:hypothetical protein [Micromonospora chokoriensis]|uniref:Uncharacterized protein n=1 Tax=Micromonospora chokoriensis TaxID=356851 RepID=A0A1C4WN69_9ACTN|nr:hypothetical protein [Micromonospora chokoriensis]SCE97624.1 hypothetical protein GA0070612_2647 [Micromonospora chokoriensis]
MVPTVRVGTELPRLRRPQIPPASRPKELDERTVTPTPITPEVAVAPGDVVHLREQDYQHDSDPLRLRIVCVRLDLSLWYDGQWVWLEGIEMISPGQTGRFRNVLARVAALPHPQD